MTAVIIEQDIFVMHRAEEMHNLFVLAPQEKYFIEAITEELKSIDAFQPKHYGSLLVVYPETDEGVVVMNCT